MEQRDVPVGGQGFQEAQQRPGALGELEAVQHLVAGQQRASAHQVAQVRLGQIVVGQVQGLEAGRAQPVGDPPGLLAAADLDAHVDMGLVGIGNAVVELGDGMTAHQSAELQEAAAPLGDGHGKHRLAGFTDLGAFGHEAQAVEVHVGAAGHGHQGAVLHLLALGPGLQAGERQRARGLQNGPGVLEGILERRADLVGVYQDDVVDVLLAQREGLVAHALDGRAVGKQPHVVQRHRLASSQRLAHRVGVVGLHADDLDAGADGFHVGGDAGDQSAAADGHEDGVHGRPVLAQDLHGDGALAGDHVRVIERVHEGEALFGLQLQGVLIGIAEGVALQHHLATAGAHRVHLQGGSGDGHDDDGTAAQLACRQRHTLGMVAGRGADHAPGTFLGAEVGHLVVGAAQLERENGLHVLALEQHPVAQAGRQCRGGIQRGFFRHFVDAGVQDPFQVLDGHGQRNRQR